jgi:hypothetical protein
MKKSNRLEGELYVIIGGAQTIGSGIVRAILHQGASVLVPSRHQPNLTNLITKSVREMECSRLYTMHTNCATEEGMKLVKDEINLLEHEEGLRFRHVINAHQGHCQGGTIGELNPQEFQKFMYDHAGMHQFVFYHLFPIIHNIVGATYTFVTGGAAQCPPEITGGLATIGSSALQAIARVAMCNSNTHFARVNEFRVTCRVRHSYDVEHDTVSNFDVGDVFLQKCVLQVVDQKTVVIE